MEKRRVLLALLGIAVVVAIGIIAFRRLNLRASVSYPDSVVCSGNECIRRGGNSWCKKDGNKFCRETAAAPCYECLTSLSSASSTSAASAASAAASSVISSAAASSSVPWLSCATNFLCDVLWSNGVCVHPTPSCSNVSSAGTNCGNENCLGNCYYCPSGASSAPASSSLPASSVASSQPPASSSAASSNSAPVWQTCASGYSCMKTLNTCIDSPPSFCDTYEYDNSRDCGFSNCPGSCYRCAEESVSSMPAGWVSCPSGYTCDLEYDGTTCGIAPFPSGCNVIYLPETVGCGSDECDGRCYRCG